jgi:hypothetical protein
MKSEKNHKDIFVYGNKAITLKNIAEVGTVRKSKYCDSYSYVVYESGREIKLPIEMGDALLIELSLVTIVGDVT